MLMFVMLMVCSWASVADADAASITLTCPSYTSGGYNRSGVFYPCTNAGLVSVPATDVLDFLRAGYSFAYPAGQQCGTTSTCAGTGITNKLQIATGQVTLASSSVTVTGLPFTSSPTFTCVATDITAAKAVSVVNVSGASITLSGTGTDTVNYACFGY